MHKYLLAIILWTLTGSLSLAGEVLVDNIPTIVVDAYNPPNMYLHDDKAAGLYPLLLNAVFARMGEDIKVKALPWKRALAMGVQGRAGVGGIYKTKERLKTYDYSELVYNELLLVFVRRGSQFNFATMEDLKGKNIGVIMGWSYGIEFDQAKANGLFLVEAVNRDSLNFKKLSEGRLDCVVASNESALYEISRNNFDNIVALDNPLLINPTYLAFAKQSDKTELLARFNKALKEMREEGEYKQLISEFIHHIELETGGTLRP